MYNVRVHPWDPYFVYLHQDWDFLRVSNNYNMEIYLKMWIFALKYIHSLENVPSSSSGRLCNVVYLSSLFQWYDIVAKICHPRHCVAADGQIYYRTLPVFRTFVHVS